MEPLAKKTKHDIGTTKRIVIWDLDETLIIFDSLRTGRHFTQQNVSSRGVQLGARLSSSLMALLDGVFLFKKLEGYEICQVSNNASSSKSGKADDLCLVYTRYNGEPELTSLVPKSWLEERELLLSELDDFTGGWLTEASKSLSANFELGGLNTLVSSSHIVAALGKLVYFKLDHFFKPEQVYSAAHRSKMACFVDVVRDHGVVAAGGDLPIVVAIGDGDEEAQAAAGLEIEFTKVNSLSDLRNFIVQFRLPHIETATSSGGNEKDSDEQKVQAEFSALDHLGALKA